MSLNNAPRVLQDIEQLLHAHGISSVGPHQVRLTTSPASSSAVHTFNVQLQVPTRQNVRTPACIC